MRNNKRIIYKQDLGLRLSYMMWVVVIAGVMVAMSVQSA